MIPRQQLWQAGHNRTINILGRALPVKQTVVWAAMGAGGILKMGRLGNRIFLVQCDHQGEPLKEKAVYRSLKFFNTDFQLDIPMISICSVAREWLDKAGENLILNLVEEKLPDLGVRPQEIGKFVQLLAVQEPGKGKTYAVLALNA